MFEVYTTPQRISLYTLAGRGAKQGDGARTLQGTTVTANLFVGLFIYYSGKPTWNSSSLTHRDTFDLEKREVNPFIQADTLD